MSTWAPGFFASYVRSEFVAVALKLALCLAFRKLITSWSISNGRSSNNVCDQHRRILGVADCIGSCLVGGLRRKHRTDNHGHCSHAAQDHQMSSCSCNSRCGHCAACHKDCCNAGRHHQVGRQAGPSYRYTMHPFTIVAILFCTHLHQNRANKPKQALNNPIFCSIRLVFT